MQYYYKGTYTHSHPIYPHDRSSAPLSNSSLADLKLILSVTSSADLELRLGFSLGFSLMRLNYAEVLSDFSSIQLCYIGSFSYLISISLMWPSCVKTFSMLKNSLLEI